MKPRFLSSARSLSRFFSLSSRRKLLCAVLILSLLSLPGSLYADAFSAVADSTIEISVKPVRWIASLFDLFSPGPARPRQMRLVDRINQVSTIQVSPSRIVGYQGDSIIFSALGRDFSGQTVQGVRFSWESSDTAKLLIDNTGQAQLLQPGLVQITCRAGSSLGVAHVLIRPGSRPPQTDQQWSADQDSFVSGSSPTGAAAKMVESLIDHLAPTAYAQGCNQGFVLDSSDFGYDELWSEPRNLTGNPRNRTVEPFRMGSVLPEGSNFNFSIPLYGLGGRGMAASLMLYYNSRVWTRHGNAITFNPTQNWPFAGFSIGFGRIFTYGSGASTKYVLIDPDGTLRYLGAGSDTTSGTYQTADGSHITFVGSKAGGGFLYFNDGTRVSIGVVNNRLLPTRIRNSNGNFIDISYKPYNASSFPIRKAINYVTDTLGRQLQFNYDDCANLVSITVPQFSTGTHEIVRFDYQSLSISNSFSGLTVENLPGTSRGIKHIFFPQTSGGYKFDYSAYGMIYNVTMRKDMTYNSQTGAISDGTQRSSISFNYPTSASSLTDAPSFTQRSETATDAPNATYTYSTSTGSGTKTFTVTRPDNSQLLLTRSTTGSNDGLLIETEVKNSSGGSMAKSVFTYANDPGGFPQVESVTSYDDAGTPSKVDYQYDAYGNVTVFQEYGHQILGNWQVRRKTQTTYKTDTAYINAYLRSLVTENKVYDAMASPPNDLISKTTFTFDNYAPMGGLENYSGQQMPPGHDSSFDANYTVRGNVTKRTEYKDIAAGQTIIHNRKWDIFGSVVKEEMGCACSQQEMMHEETNGYFAPVMVKQGTGSGSLETEMAYDYNTGLRTSTTDPRGEVTSYSYDSTLRVEEVTYPTTANAEVSYDDSALTSSKTLNYSEGGSGKSVTTSYSYDGLGRVISETQPNGAKVDTTYDSMGRVWKRTNPYTTGQTPVETVNTYDALDRVTAVTLPDGQTIQTSYSGSSVTVTDQVNRKIKREVDGLGRLVKVFEQTSAGGGEPGRSASQVQVRRPGPSAV